MEHVVFFSEDSGQSEFRRVGDLESAVRLVESLRNERGIADVTLHALTPVPVSFRTYYRVEVATADLPTAQDAPDDEPDPSDDVPALAVPRLADEPRPTPVLLAVPALLDDTADGGPLALEDDAAATASYGTLTSLSYEPLEGFTAPDDADATRDEDAVRGVDAVHDTDAVHGADAVHDADAVHEIDPSADELEVLVPLSRPEPQAERSLGYFAR